MLRVLRYSSHISFWCAKYLADGSFDKIKARLVVDGRDKDPQLNPNKSSPTVAIHLVFTVLGMAATKTWRIVMKIDVKSICANTYDGQAYLCKVGPKDNEVCNKLAPRIWSYGRR